VRSQAKEFLYTTEGGKSRIQHRTDANTVWPTQREMADLFATTQQNISLHLQNIFEDGELRKVLESRNP